VRAALARVEVILTAGLAPAVVLAWLLDHAGPIPGGNLWVLLTLVGGGVPAMALVIVRDARRPARRRQDAGA
jgi:hypothetical protein